MELFDFAAASARREFQRPASVRDVAVDLFRRLGETRTSADAAAIAEQAATQAAALIEIATLAERRAQALTVLATEKESQ